MLSTEEAQIVQKAVNRKIFNGDNIFHLEDAVCMTQIPCPPDSEVFTIWAVQIDDMTVMVLIDKTDDGIQVRKAQRIVW